jgi:ribosome hibernation promoting factor
MKIHIVARHTKLTKAIKEHVELKIEKLQNYFDKIIWAQVALNVEKKENSAEIVLHAGRQTLKSSGKSSDLYSAVDAAVSKMEVQIKKYKEKLRDHRKSDDIEQDISLPTAIIEDEVKISVVKQVGVKPMDAQTAAMEMDRLGYTFWMFIDKDTNKVNIVFKRLDNSFGVLQPIKRG